MHSAELGHQLRRGSGRFLRLRRVTLSLSLTAAGAMMPIALYQLGVIQHLPEPPLPRLDADTVDAAAEAYAALRTPDAVLGLVSYAVTAWLAAAGGEERDQTMPWVPAALAAKATVDAAVGIKLGIDQWTHHRAFCSWCLLAATASVASVPFVLPEAWAALAPMAGTALPKP